MISKLLEKIEPFRRGAVACIFAATLLMVPIALLQLSLFEYSDGSVRRALSFAESAGVPRVALNDYDKTTRLIEWDGLTLYHVDSQYAVTVSVHGISTALMTNSNVTVQQLLERLNVVLGADDVVSRPLDDTLARGEALYVDCVTYYYRTVTETVPYTRGGYSSPLLPDGQVTVVTAGVDGLAERVYRDTYVNGVLTASSVDAQTVLVQPQSSYEIIGDANSPVSQLTPPSDIQIVDNVPSSYATLYEGGNCTAYSASAGSYGASGMRIFAGTVATNPSVIPYGTLLYITSADGSFVYGFALAADTGTAMLDGNTFIDLFMTTNSECSRFGRRYLNVYVIRQMYQDELGEFVANGMFYNRVPSR